MATIRAVEDYPNVDITAEGGPLNSTNRVQVAHGVQGEAFHWDEMDLRGTKWKASVTPRSTRGREFRFDIYYYNARNEQTFLGSKYLFIQSDRNMY